MDRDLNAPTQPEPTADVVHYRMTFDNAISTRGRQTHYTNDPAKAEAMVNTYWPYNNTRQGRDTRPGPAPKCCGEDSDAHHEQLMRDYN